MNADALDLAGRAALVTGAGVGIGAATAKLLAARGAWVAIHCNRSKAEAEAVLADVRAAGGDGAVLQADLGDPQQAGSLAGQVARASPTGGLDILVNNAGSPIARARMADCSLDLWNQVLAVNLTGPMLVTQGAIPLLSQSSHGAIVNNLSLSVQTGGANGAGPYAIAKGGLGVMTRTLARELAPAVRVNSVMPGVIETRHHEQFSTPQRMAEYRRETPLGRNGQAEEVAEVIAFLVSDAARFMNGAILDISGGRFLR